MCGVSKLDGVKLGFSMNIFDRASRHAGTVRNLGTTDKMNVGCSVLAYA